MSNPATTIRAIRALKKGAESRRALTAAEALEVIRAYRRGVSMANIAKALGHNRANIYSLLGSFALRHCQCPERES